MSTMAARSISAGTSGHRGLCPERVPWKLPTTLVPSQICAMRFAPMRLISHPSPFISSSRMSSSKLCLMAFSGVGAGGVLLLVFIKTFGLKPRPLGRLWFVVKLCDYFFVIRLTLYVFCCASSPSAFVLPEILSLTVRIVFTTLNATTKNIQRQPNYEEIITASPDCCIWFLS